MKAIKDCEWGIWIQEDSTPEKKGFWWVAEAIEDTGLYTHLVMENYFKLKSSVKRNWGRFAKINGIKKWRYV